MLTVTYRTFLSPTRCKIASDRPPKFASFSIKIGVCGKYFLNRLITSKFFQPKFLHQAAISFFIIPGIAIVIADISPL